MLRCYAEARDGVWEAICLDLDIAVQGCSFDEVLGSLRRAVALYLETVAALPSHERSALLARRAPLAIRAKSSARVLWGRGASSDRSRQWRRFTMPAA
jgi:hypothetical protein